MQTSFNRLSFSPTSLDVTFQNGQVGMGKEFSQLHRRRTWWRMWLPARFPTILWASQKSSNPCTASMLSTWAWSSLTWTHPGSATMTLPWAWNMSTGVGKLGYLSHMIQNGTFADAACMQRQQNKSPAAHQRQYMGGSTWWSVCWSSLTSTRMVALLTPRPGHCGWQTRKA